MPYKGSREKKSWLMRGYVYDMIQSNEIATIYNFFYIVSHRSRHLLRLGAQMRSCSIIILELGFEVIKNHVTLNIGIESMLPLRLAGGSIA